MFSKEMEALIEATLQDGVLTDQEKAVLVKRAQKEGIDIDELDIYIQSIMQKRHQAEAEEAAKADRQSKMGSVKRCPNCGAPVQPGDAACASCGYAFNADNKSSKSSIERLYDKLDEINKTKGASGGFSRVWNASDPIIERKMDIISNFPVPNNRADLLDFLTAVQPRARKNGPKNGLKNASFEDLSFAYWNLYANCIMKAKISFANDSAFQYYFDHYEKETKKGFFARLFGKK